MHTRFRPIPTGEDETNHLKKGSEQPSQKLVCDPFVAAIAVHEPCVKPSTLLDPNTALTRDSIIRVCAVNALDVSPEAFAQTIALVGEGEEVSSCTTDIATKLQLVEKENNGSSHPSAPKHVLLEPPAREVTDSNLALRSRIASRAQAFSLSTPASKRLLLAGPFSEQDASEYVTPNENARNVSQLAKGGSHSSSRHIAPAMQRVRAEAFSLGTPVANQISQNAHPFRDPAPGDAVGSSERTGFSQNCAAPLDKGSLPDVYEAQKPSCGEFDEQTHFPKVVDTSEPEGAETSSFAQFFETQPRRNFARKVKFTVANSSASRTSSDDDEQEEFEGAQEGAKGRRLGLHRSDLRPTANVSHDIPFHGRVVESVVSYDKDGNGPWFQNRLGDTNSKDVWPQHSEVELNSTQGARSITRKIEKLGRLFKVPSFDSSLASPGGSSDAPDSGSFIPFLDLRRGRGGSSADQGEIKETLHVDGDASTNLRFEMLIKLALAGKAGLIEVLDMAAAFQVPPGSDLTALWYKYLCKDSTLECSVRALLSDYSPSGAARAATLAFKDYRLCTPYREMLAHSFINGPSRLRRGLMGNPKARSEFLKFFETENTPKDADLTAWGLKVHTLARILNRLVAESPCEMTDCIASRKGFLRLLVTNYIGAPEVAEFVVQLCAADALSEDAGDELRYGAANAAGVILLAKEKICDLLVEVIEQAPSLQQGLSCQRRQMATHCLLELSKRSLVIPKFGKFNCSYSNRYIKTVNTALTSLSALEEPHRLSRIIAVGLKELFMKGSDLYGDKDLSSPLVCSLQAATSLLDIVHAASESKLAVTRRTVGKARTDGLEAVLLTRFAQFTRLIKNGRLLLSRERCMVQLAVLESYCSLFASQRSTTLSQLAKERVPDMLIQLLVQEERSSIIHCRIVRCVSLSFKNKAAHELRQAWFRALKFPGTIAEVLRSYFGEVHNSALSDARAPRVAEQRRGYSSAFLEIGLILHRYASTQTAETMRRLVGSADGYRAFVEVSTEVVGRIAADRALALGGSKPEQKRVSVLSSRSSMAAWSLEAIDCL